MKKILTLVVLSSALLFTSCNKNKKFNKDLDGTWAVTVEDGSPVDAGDQSKIHFSKDKKDNGTVTITDYENGTAGDTYAGTYKITDKGETLTIDATHDGSTYHSSGKVSNQDDKKFTYNATVSVSGTLNGVMVSFTDTSISQLEKQ